MHISHKYIAKDCIKTCLLEASTRVKYLDVFHRVNSGISSLPKATARNLPTVIRLKKKFRSRQGCQDYKPRNVTSSLCRYW